MSVTRSIVIRLLLVALAPLVAAASPGTNALGTNGLGTAPVYAEATIGAASTQAPLSSESTVSGFTPAPMPDLDRQAPTQDPGEKLRARVAPTLVHRPDSYHGEGYVFGSTAQDQQDERIRPGPGINLLMPLQ